jgi:iron complex outermembrane receptor protein
MKHLNFSKAVKASTSVLAMTCLLAADAAFAQDNDDEIIVTARRTAETLIEAPVAVAAFGENAIEDLALRSVDDVARHTAGFSFSKAFGRTTERPVIRGAANILAGVQFGVEAGAAYFIDGVYYSGDLQAVDTRGLERIEVVKGPQSALYGRNTYSGAVNFITKRPSESGFEGSLEGLAAEDGEYELYGRVSNSVEDGSLGFALSGRYYSYDGDSAWINADGGEQLGGEETVSVNAVVDANISDNFSIIARVGHVQDDDDARPFRLIGAEQNNCYPGYRSGANYSNDGGVPGFLQGFAPWINTFDSIDPATQTDSNFQYFCGDLSQFEDLAPAQTLTAGPFFGVERDMTYGSVKTELDFGEGYNLESSFGFRQQEITTGADSNHLPGETGPANGSPYVFPISPFFSVGQPDGVFYNAGNNDSSDYSFEARLASPADKSIRWSLGAFIYDFSEDVASLSFGITAPGNLGEAVDKRTVKNKAIFGTLDFDVNEQLTLSLEGRYQEESKGLLERDTGYENEAKFEKFIPKAIISYDLTDDASVYGSYAKGLKPGGINGPIGVATGDEFYEEEESDAFELGYKSRFADGRGRITVAGFFNDVTNYQLTTPVAVAGSTAINSVATNQGSAEIKGVELEASFDINDYVTIGGSYAYTDAKFTKGCDDFEFTLNTGGFLISAFDRTNPPENGTIRATPVDGTRTATAATTTPFYDPQNFFTGNLSCSIAGNTIPMTSENQGSLYAKLEYPVSDDMDMFANVDFTHEGSKFIQVHNGMETGDTNMIGAQLGVKFNNVRLEIFGRNLTNERTPPIATRWFDLQEGFNSLAHDPAGTNARAAIDRNVTGPRSAFISYRQGRQIGVRAKVDF